MTKLQYSCRVNFEALVWYRRVPFIGVFRWCFLYIMFFFISFSKGGVFWGQALAKWQEFGVGVGWGRWSEAGTGKGFINGERMCTTETDMCISRELVCISRGR